MSRSLPKIALMLGNIVTGLSVLAPAAMLQPLAAALGVNIHVAGLLVTYGAVVLCIASPVSAWLTTKFDRRLLLAGTIGFVAIGEALTAFATDYATVLILRLIMLAVVALYTPQAAAAVGLIVPERERAGAIAFVFLGWSLAVAGGMPFVTYLTEMFGWRAAYGALAMLGFGIAALLLLALPKGLLGSPLSLRSFAAIASSATITTILLITLLTTSGQFTVVIYMAPLLDKLTGHGAATAGLLFGLMGTLGLIGNIIATSIVPRFGAQITFAAFLGMVTVGLGLWAVGAGFLPVMALGIAFLGLGFAASNSMQQARLAAAAPDLASASIALNTSLIYVGQAVGSGVGGLLFARSDFYAHGYIATAFSLAAVVLLALSWRRARLPKVASPAE